MVVKIAPFVRNAPPSSMKRDGCHKQIVREELLDGAARFASQTSIRTFLVIEREIAVYVDELLKSSANPLEREKRTLQ